MKSRLIIVLTCGSSVLRAAPAEEVAEESSMSEFALVTGFHRVIHKSSGFDRRRHLRQSACHEAVKPPNHASQRTGLRPAAERDNVRRLGDGDLV